MAVQPDAVVSAGLWLVLQPPGLEEAFWLDGSTQRVLYWADLVGTFLIIARNALAFSTYHSHSLFHRPASLGEFLSTWQPILFILLAFLQLATLLRFSRPTYMRHRKTITLSNRALRVFILALSLSSLTPERVNNMILNVFSRPTSSSPEGALQHGQLEGAQHPSSYHPRSAQSKLSVPTSQTCGPSGLCQQPASAAAHQSSSPGHGLVRSSNHIKPSSSYSPSIPSSSYSDVDASHFTLALLKYQAWIPFMHVISMLSHVLPLRYAVSFQAAITGAQLATDRVFVCAAAAFPPFLAAASRSCRWAQVLAYGVAGFLPSTASSAGSVALMETWICSGAVALWQQQLFIDLTVIFLLPSACTYMLELGAKRHFVASKGARLVLPFKGLPGVGSWYVLGLAGLALMAVLWLFLEVVLMWLGPEFTHC